LTKIKPILWPQVKISPEGTCLLEVSPFFTEKTSKMISYQTEKQGGEGGLHLPKQQLEGPHIPPPSTKNNKN